MLFLNGTRQYTDSSLGGREIPLRRKLVRGYRGPEQKDGSSGDRFADAIFLRRKRVQLSSKRKMAAAAKKSVLSSLAVYAEDSEPESDSEAGGAGSDRGGGTGEALGRRRRWFWLGLIRRHVSFLLWKLIGMAPSQLRVFAGCADAS